MNSIPAFDENHVLPPFKGEDLYLSPYKSNIVEVCKRFASSTERICILHGLITFREELFQRNIKQGFQWLYGSFTENIEVSETRIPKDLDLVTFFYGLSLEEKTDLKETFPEFVRSKKAKEKYKLDHSAHDISVTPELTVETISHLMQLCTHTREGVWKGIVRIELNTPDEDKMALEYLEGLKV